MGRKGCLSGIQKREVFVLVEKLESTERKGRRDWFFFWSRGREKRRAKFEVRVSLLLVRSECLVKK